MLNRLLSNLIGRVWLSHKYKSWKEAKKYSAGYEYSNILRKIKKIYKTQINELGHHEFYERDGILFKNKINDVEIIRFLNKAKKKLKNISILDFGGSLGSIYFSNFDYLKGNIMTWSIVEQSHYVDIGKKIIENEKVKFYKNFEKCIKKENPNIAIFSGSLQYLDTPYQTLEKVKKSNINYILIDKIPVKSRIQNDEYYIQYVPKSINDGSYPIRVFSEDHLKKFLNKNKFKIINIKNISSPFFTIGYKSIILKNEKHIL